MLIAIAGLLIVGIGIFIGAVVAFLLLFVGVPFAMAYAWAIVTADLDNMPDWHGFGIWKRTLDILFN